MVCTQLPSMKRFGNYLFQILRRGFDILQRKEYFVLKRWKLIEVSALRKNLGQTWWIMIISGSKSKDIGTWISSAKSCFQKMLKGQTFFKLSFMHQALALP